jgi:protein SCO1/2
MKNLSVKIILLLACIVPMASASLPVDSIWQLNATVVQQNGKPTTLASLAGKPRLVSMFYSSCPYMCPLIIDTASAVQHGLTKQERAKLGIALISIDPKHDSPEVLQSLMQKRRLDDQSWMLVSADDRTVRQIAALLGVRYRELEGGGFNHTSVLILVDADGRIVARTEKMGIPVDKEFMTAVHALLR